MGVGRSGYYAWRKRGKSNRAIENERLIKRIREIFYDRHQIYGSPRITRELQDEGIEISRQRVARLMRNNHLRSKMKRKFVHTTQSRHNLPTCPHVLDRQFEPGQMGRAWVSDITYIHTQEGWLYLTIFLDLADRQVIGWSLSETMEAYQTVIKAWKMACINRTPSPGLIVHSDRGVQYAANDFKEQLAKHHQIIQSMSRKGNCWDNAPAEAFFKSLKSEWLDHMTLVNRKQAKTAVFQYIEIFYNRIRKHSTLGYKSPNQFFQQIQAITNSA